SRVMRLRHNREKSVLSIGRAGTLASSAASAITSSLGRRPTRYAAAADASIGRDATAPNTRRAASMVPSGAIFADPATDSTGKSNEPRRRSFQYVLRHPIKDGR